jgi:hypothetical protein
VENIVNNQNETWNFVKCVKCFGQLRDNYQLHNKDISMKLIISLLRRTTFMKLIIRF